MKWTRAHRIEFIRSSNEIEGILDDGQGCPYLVDHRKALTYALRGGHGEREILETHRRLMVRILPPVLAAQLGAWRTVEVRVGGDAGAPSAMVPIHMDKWCEERALDERSAWERHLWFETIHPFVDGNGRVGRLLWAAERTALGLPPAIVDPARRQLYYDEIRRWRAGTWRPEDSVADEIVRLL